MTPLFRILNQCAGDIEKTLAVGRVDFGESVRKLLDGLAEELRSTAKRVEFGQLVWDRMTDPPGVLTDRQAIAAVLKERPDLAEYQN